MRGSWLQRSSLVPHRLCAASWNGHTCHACCSIGSVVAELSWSEDKLVSPQKRHALLTERYPLPRCTTRAPRRAPRRRRQPSSDWPRWTRRAARRGRPPCARPWRCATGRRVHTLGQGAGARASQWAAQQAAMPCRGRSCAPSQHAARQCAEQVQSAPAGGHGMVCWRGGACCRLLTGEGSPPRTSIVYPVTAEDMASYQGADTACLCFAECRELLPLPAPGHGRRAQGGGCAAAR